MTRDLLAEPVLVQEARGVSWLTLNRPASLNAISFEMLRLLMAQLDRIEGDPVLRAVVLTGSGRAFCAGVDLKDAQARAGGGSSAAATGAFNQALACLLERLERFPKPVIAAVNGAAAAGGLELLLCCDLAIASADARIGDAHARYGLIPAGGATARLPRRVGLSLAKYMIFTGEMLSAAELATSGLLHKVVEPQVLRAEAARLASVLAGRSPLALRRAKQLIREGMELPLEEALAREQAAVLAHALSHDRLEGLAAFAEKRTPNFTGT